MEDTQIIALYLSRQEAAIGETAKKYGGYINRIAYKYPALPGGYGGNRGGYVSGCVECHSTGNSQSAEAFPVPDRPESGF